MRKKLTLKKPKLTLTKKRLNLRTYGTNGRKSKRA